MKETYQQKAYLRLGIKQTDWMPILGFTQNLTFLHKLYYYYQQVYLLQPNLFLWMGLARLTGGQVLWGMSNLIKISKDPSVLTQRIVLAAKDIFENLAWQHEYFLDKPAEFLAYIKELDKINTHKNAYYKAWQLIFTNKKENIAKGNEMLLENEQLNTIQHHYDEIKKDSYAKKYFWFTRFVMRCIHPYHNRFILDFPFEDVTNFKARWKWITHKKGMWISWVATPSHEKIRLISLCNEAIIKHKW